MTPNEFLKTQANPDDVIAITCNEDWELTHLENLLEEYHQAKLKLLGIGVVVGQSEQYHCELYDFGRKDKPCDKQCDGCKAMNLH